MFSCREQIFLQFNMRKNTWNRAVVTSSMLFCAYGLAILFPDITCVYGVIGGLFCSTSGWIVPFIIKLKILDIEGQKWYNCTKFFYYIALLGVIVISIISAVQSIVGF